MAFVLGFILIASALSSGFGDSGGFPRDQPPACAEILNLVSHAEGEPVARDRVIEARAGRERVKAKVFAERGQSQLSASPEEAAREFYTWYLHALYQSPGADPVNEHKSDFEKYVTARLLQKLANSRRTSTVRKGPDCDIEYFFGTLDLDSDWETNIVVSKPAMKGLTALIRLTLSGRGDSGQDRKVAMKQESGLWKIDGVDLWRQ